MTRYEALIRSASTNMLDTIDASWWARTSGTPLETINGWIEARRTDLRDQEIIRKREEVIE